MLIGLCHCPVQNSTDRESDDARGESTCSNHDYPLRTHWAFLATTYPIFGRRNLWSPFSLLVIRSNMGADILTLEVPKQMADMAARTVEQR
jgi:hypothetical protein